MCNHMTPLMTRSDTLSMSTSITKAIGTFGLYFVLVGIPQVQENAHNALHKSFTSDITSTAAFVTD